MHKSFLSSSYTGAKRIILGIDQIEGVSVHEKEFHIVRGVLRITKSSATLSYFEIDEKLLQDIIDSSVNLETLVFSCCLFTLNNVPKFEYLSNSKIKLIDFSQNSKLNQKSILRIIGGIQDAYRPKESNDIVIPDKNLNEIEEEEKNEERKIDPSDTDQKLLILFKSKDIEKEILENDLYREQFDDELSYNIHFK